MESGSRIGIKQFRRAAEMYCIALGNDCANSCIAE